MNRGTSNHTIWPPPAISREDRKKLRLPDWRDAGAYPSVQRVRWVWEFIRRNPSYRLDYQHGKLDPALAETLAARWSAKNLPDPSDGEVWPEFVRGRVELILNIPGFVWRPRYSHEIGIVFDLRRPLAAQLRVASKTLQREAARLPESQQPQNRKPRLSKMPHYLRIVDAFMQSESSKDARAELLAALHPLTTPRGHVGIDERRDALRKDVAAAEYYYTGGYRDLLE